MKVAKLLSLDAESQTETSLLPCLGDGFLQRNNAVYRSIRAATIDAEFSFTLEDPGTYFGFPLVHLDLVYSSRKLPYRDSRGGLAHLEGLRPGFFRLKDLTGNRPAPSYLLHESAHAIAFDRFFGRSIRGAEAVRDALADPAHLERILVGESFAMTSEYFAACLVSGKEHTWFHSISSYQRVARRKKRVGELVESRGLAAARLLVLGAFLAENHLRPGLRPREADALLELLSSRPLRKKERERYLPALKELTRVDPGFLRDTSRLFLGSLGYSRRLDEVLSSAPVLAALADAALADALPALLATIRPA